MRTFNSALIRLLFILLLAFFFLPAVNSQNLNGNPPITFQKIFTVSTTVTPIKIITTKDGGYFVSGFQTDELVGNGDGFALKLNKYGNKEWIKGYNRFEADYNIFGSTQLPDSSYVLLAELDGKGVIQKINKNGALIWQNAYELQTGSIRFTNIISSGDGSFFVSGEYSDNMVSSIIIKFDPDGNSIWQKIFLHYGILNNFPNSLILNGTELIVNGLIPEITPGAADTIYIMKLNTGNGEVTAAKKIWLGSSTVSGGFSLVKRTDNGLVLSAGFFDQVTAVRSNSLIGLNDNLELVNAEEILNLPDGYFVASAASAENNNIAIAFQDLVQNTGLLMKLDNNLQPVFARSYQQTFNGISESLVTDIAASPDSGFVLSNRKFGFDSVFCYIIKTDKDGNTGSCNSTEISIGTQPLIPGISDFAWPSVMDLNSGLLIVNVPEVSVNNSETTLCTSFSCITAVPSNNTYTGGNPNVIYLGYGPQSVTLQTSNEAGNTYNWTGNGNLSCYHCANPVFSPTAPGNYSFTVTITTGSGVVTSCSISICVLDVRVPGSNGKKVFLCHVPPGNPNSSNQLSISINAVGAHLRNHAGDKLGICGQSCNNSFANNSIVTYTEKQADEDLAVLLYPNPVKDAFTIGTKGNIPGKLSVKIMTIEGKVIYTLNDIIPGSRISIGDKLPPGLYYVEISFSGKKETLKLLKL